MLQSPPVAFNALIATQTSFVQRLGARGAAGEAGGSQGLGPRLGRLPRARHASGGALLGSDRPRRRQPGGTAGRQSHLRAQQEQQPTLVVQPGDSSGEEPLSGSGIQNTMHSQPYLKQGLPSSRSDTMLLQPPAAEGGRFGLFGGGSRGASNGLGRTAAASAGAASGATAAVGNGQAAPRTPKRSPNEIPVYVMLPLDTVNADGVFRYASSKWFTAALQRLAATGIRGVAVDVWWGAVERKPRRYNWSGYRQLFALVRALGLKLQVVLSFHACGGNVGDNAQIPLPQWVLKVGESDPDIFFTDRPRELFPGQRNRECLSFFADEEPGLLRGRSPMQCYAEFMRAFRDEFLPELGPGSLIEEVVVGCGPCGELRYPSYPEANGWRFPGVGEFQCYDRRALASLAAAAREHGEPEWGNTGPHDAGSYNASPEETGFFCSWGGNWETPYGSFFLEWYSGALLEHGERMLTAATSVFNTRVSAAAQGWPAAISGSRSRSLPDLPASGGAAPRGHASGLPRVPVAAGGAADPRQGSPPTAGGGGAAAEPSEPLLYSGGGAFDAGLADSYRLQQAQQQQAAAAAAAADSPSADAAPASPAPSPAPLGPPLAPGSAPPVPGVAAQQAGGLGMRQHASFSSLRSSVSESEDWMGDAGSGGLAPAGPPVHLTLKVAGVHWWYRTRSHAAELTAGYYNTEKRDGYRDILELCARHGASLTLTCVEMCDSQHPPEALCGPEGLLRQVREVAAAVGVSVAGENALPCFMPSIIDEHALHRIVYNTQPWGTPLQTGAASSGLDPAGPLAAAAAPPGGSAASSPASASTSGSPSSSGEAAAAARLPPMRAFTFLRLTDTMMSDDYQATWARFMHLMSHNAQRFRSSAAWRRDMGFE